MQKRIGARLWGALALVVAAALMRLLPHAPNFSPIAAMALFGAATFDRKAWAFVLPLAAMLLSDLVLGFHDQMFAVYGAFILIELLGLAVLRERHNPSRLVLASLASSLLFFLITNASVWAFSGMYSKDAAGLAACFVAAVPFLQNGIAGDLVFTGTLFGAMHLIERTVARRAELV